MYKLSFLFLLFSTGCLFADSSQPLVGNNASVPNNASTHLGNNNSTGGTVSTTTTTTTPTNPDCGNGILDGKEECDPQMIGSCAEFVGAPFSGEVKCSTSCKFDGDWRGSCVRPAEVIAGGNTTCKIGRGGKVRCWGNDLFQQNTTLPARFKKIAIGKRNICGIDLKDKIQCWGESNAITDAGKIPSGKFKELSISSIAGYGCAVNLDDSIECWGNKAPEFTGDFEKVSIGPIHSCAMRKNDQMVECRSTTSVSIVPESALKDLAVGWNQTCGIKADNKLACWGRITKITKGTYETTPPTKTYEKVVTGAFHVCGLNADKEIDCWTLNTGGGKYRSHGQARPPEGRKYVDLTAGDFHTCALTEDAKVECWGRNNDGQGNNRVYASKNVKADAVLKRDGSVTFNDQTFGTFDTAFRQISLGKTYACGVDWSGNARCIGDTPPNLESLTIEEIRVGNVFYCYSFRDDMNLLQLKCSKYLTSARPLEEEEHSFDVTGSHVTWLMADEPCAGASASQGCYNGKTSTQGAANGLLRQGLKPHRDMVFNGRHQYCYLDKTNKAFCHDNANGKMKTPSKRFREIAGGSDTFCGIQMNGDVLCWKLVNSMTVKLSRTITGFYTSLAILQDGRLKATTIDNVPELITPDFR